MARLLGYPNIPTHCLLFQVANLDLRYLSTLAILGCYTLAIEVDVIQNALILQIAYICVMCYHTATPDAAQLRKTFKDLTVLYNQPEIFHVSGFTRPTLPVTLNTNIDEIVPARWKLIPFWVKDEAAADKYANTLNARNDDIFEKASYKNAIGKYRGLLYVKGFFEPHASDGKKNDQTYFIQDPSSDIFTLGVVWSPWKDYNTFSIITTEANEQMAEIHNVGKRMPLIIPPDLRDNWLLAEGREEIESLMVPYAGELKTHRTFRVTSARGMDTNKPEIQIPI